MNRHQLCKKRIRNRRRNNRIEVDGLKRRVVDLTRELRSKIVDYETISGEHDRMKALYAAIFAYDVFVDRPDHRSDLWRATVQLTTHAIRHIRDMKPLIQDVAIKLCMELTKDK